MTLQQGAQPGPVLGKRFRDDSNNPVLLTPIKKRKEDTTFTSYPTPESTQSSSAESSSGKNDESRVTQPNLQKTSLNKSPRSAKSRAKADAAHLARTQFLAEWRNYIPLGSLTLSTDNGRGGCFHQAEWTELDSGTWFVLQSHLTEWGPALSAKKLLESGFARVFGRSHQISSDLVTLRVYVLPDDVGRRYIDRRGWRGTSKLKGYLRNLIDQLDISSESWEGRNCIADEEKRYDVDTKDNDSLFYLFNMIPSPPSTVEYVPCPVSNDAIQSVLHSVQLRGLNTQLYPYQRRTVATMIRREVKPGKASDPRFQKLGGPTGQTFFYDHVTDTLLRDGRDYEEARGGILGESMGLGKTLICLATILATQGNWPEIPPAYSVNLCPVRVKVGSLMQMAAAAVGRTQIPWRALFKEASRAGQDHQNLTAMLEDNIGSYVIPPPQAKYSRRSSLTLKGRTIRLSTATLIIVPQNLLSQWRTEISNHVEDDGLQILYLELGNEIPIPPVEKLLQYDVIVMSRPRFEREMVPSETIKASSKAVKAGGCLCSLDEDCHCSRIEEYRTPLKEIHWLRIIMDEGHEFSSSGRSGAAYWALRDLRVDRKWIVSGTPVNGLLGVEVGTATNETSESLVSNYSTSNRTLLESRRKESALAQESKDLEKLGVLVTGFLQVKPWANTKEDDPASWQKYIMPYRDGRRKAGSLKNLLESLVVRHRIEDIEADIQLPPLYNKYVYLKPSWHDRLSVNLFILHLTVNAVTSERVDEDYMFHPKNRKQLNALINNLRHSGFYWTGMAPEDIEKTSKISSAYLEKQQAEILGCSETDRLLLEKAITIGRLVLESAPWRSFAELHEMGMYVAHFPEHARSAWSLVPGQRSDLLLIGATQLVEAQTWVDNHLYAADPSTGLADLGASTMHKLWQGARRESDVEVSDKRVHSEQVLHNPGSKPHPNLPKVPRLTTERTVSRAKAALQSQKPTKTARSQQPYTPSDTGKPSGLKTALKSALKTAATEPAELLPPDSPLAKSKLCGTASAKLSYLLDRVTVLHLTEKILIFYEGDQIAWYIAQALDLMDIRYLIYTKSLSLARQTAYIATFNKTETFRVLLMNVHQAAHGLHIASASRVFFVNPVWQPNVEAQAIKRAHRIGQTRPVYVETLVLKDTLEDQMLQRRTGMTAQEHQKAERSLLDDDTMSSIIKSAQFIPLLDEELHDVSKQMAKLETPHQIFARASKGEGDFNDPDADLIFPEGVPMSKKEKEKQKRFSARRTLTKASTSNAQNGRRFNGQAFYPGPSDADQELGSPPAPSIRKPKVNFEHGPALSDAPAPVRKVTTTETDEGDMDDKRSQLTASTASPNRSLPQASSSGVTGRSKKRVGFALDPANAADDELPSLFGKGGTWGNSSPRHEGIRENAAWHDRLTTRFATIPHIWRSIQGEDNPSNRGSQI